MSGKNNSEYKQFLEEQLNNNNNLSTQKNTLNTERHLLDLSSLESLGKENLELLEALGNGRKVNGAYQKPEKKKNFEASSLLKKICKRNALNLHEKKTKSKRQLLFDFFRSNIQNIIFFIYCLQNYKWKNFHINVSYQLNFLKNLYLPDYNIFSNNYNLLDDFYQYLMNKFRKTVLTFFHDNDRNSFSLLLWDFSGSAGKGYKSSHCEDYKFVNTWPFKIIINDIGDILCIFSNGVFVKIYCFKYSLSISNCLEYTNYLNIEIKLTNYEEKIYVKICKIEFDINYINKIKKAINIYELIKGIVINRNNIIFVNEKEIFYDIFTFLKIIKFPIYKRIKTVKIIIYAPVQFPLMEEESNRLANLYGNKSTFYEEFDSFANKYDC